ncbi:REP-associated tyrosine transposase [Ferrimonas pelagia]|uniref:Transposase n=1 Tax=Ferrimonas pelagia TaxID=1177826 RepID=A0ABP9EFE2_9GAMM
MPNYRRAWQQGGTYFFTVVLANRNNADWLKSHIDALRQAVRQTQQTHPFTIHAWSVMPDHFHCVISLPPNEADFAVRIRMIKSGFTQALHQAGIGEQKIWQRGYWEHLIRDQADHNAHVDYVHINPLKHGLVTQVVDWPHSTFHRYVKQGIYPPNWAGGTERGLPYED